MLPDLYTGFSRGRSGGLVFPSLSEFPTVYCDPHSQRLWHRYLQLLCLPLGLIPSLIISASSNCCFLTCIQISQEAGWMVWDSHLFKNFPQFFVIHRVKGFGIGKKAEIDTVFFLVMRTFPIYSLSNFQIYSTIL